jgi:isoaspartyl peptidase/L-asparaginase-like protein (Ntn-hydrolase superfamily)
MDAAIMDGKTLMAGSIAGVRTIKNPITAARCVMERSEHVMMVGAGAEKFAKQCKCEFADTSYFFEQKRWNQLQKIKKKKSRSLITPTRLVLLSLRMLNSGTKNSGRWVLLRLINTEILLQELQPVE